MVNISEIKAQVALLQRVEGYKSSESKRRWWIINDESYEAKRRHLRNCMAILDQVGVNKSEAMKALEELSMFLNQRAIRWQIEYPTKMKQIILNR